MYRHMRDRYTYIDYIRTHPIYDITQVGTSRDRQLWGNTAIRSSLLNTFESKSLRLFAKENLSDYMEQMFTDAAEFMPITKAIHESAKTYPEFKESFGDKVCIFKPTGAGACAGKGIQVVSSEDEYQSAMDKLRKWDIAKRTAKSGFIKPPKSDWMTTSIVSSYINNPFLYLMIE